MLAITSVHSSNDAVTLAKLVRKPLMDPFALFYTGPRLSFFCSFSAVDWFGFRIPSNRRPPISLHCPVRL
jgi:hypothetical protein